MLKNSLLLKDKWMAIDASLIPNSVSSSSFLIFGISDINDEFYINSNYKKDVYNNGRWDKKV